MNERERLISEIFEEIEDRNWQKPTAWLVTKTIDFYADLLHDGETIDEADIAAALAHSEQEGGDT